MHVCLAGAKTCPPEIGGIEVFVFELGRRLAKRGVKVSIIVPRRRGERPVEDIEGVHVYRVTALENRYLMKTSMMPAELRIAKRLAPDVFHANDPPSGVVASFKANWRRSVVTVHGRGFASSEWPTPFRQGGRLLQRLAVSRADAVTTTDSNTAAVLKTLGRDVGIIPPGVDASVFSKSDDRRQVRSQDEKVNLLFVGRLAEVKGFDLLVESIQRLQPDVRKKIKLTIIGDGPLAPLIRGGSAADFETSWHGSVNHEDIHSYFANADLLVMPSRSEGLPITMLEAMASRVPVVASIVGGVGDFFDERHLTMIKSLTAGGVASAISEAISNHGAVEARAKSAEELVRSRFSWESVTERCLELYEKLLG